MLVIQSIASGMALQGVQQPIQFMVTGGVLLAAVVIDSVSRRSQKAACRALISGGSVPSAEARDGSVCHSPSCCPACRI